MPRQPSITLETPKRRKSRKKKTRPIERIVRAENLYIHLRGAVERLGCSNLASDHEKLKKVERVIARCKRIAGASIAELEASFA